jgi:HEAT repeats/PBS lyase HEAT-like repeat
MDTSRANRPRFGAWAGVGLIVAMVTSLSLGGCGTIGLNYEPGTKSLLQFNTGPNYQQASLRARNPYDANERYRGTLVLANAPFASEDPYLTLFEQNIEDRDPSVQMAAVRGLANHGTPEHATLLAEALDNENEIVRVEAARGLQRLHNPAAISALMRHSREGQEEDAAVRAECAHALGQYAEPRVLHHLIEVLRDDPSLTVVSSAMDALKYLTGQELGLDASQWDAWVKSEAEPFAGRTVYTYRYFHRNRKLIEWIPLVGEPPNEVSASPAGLAPDG